VGGALKNAAPPHAGRFEGPNTGCHRKSASGNYKMSGEISPRAESTRIPNPVRIVAWYKAGCTTCSTKMIDPSQQLPVCIAQNQSPNHIVTLLLPRLHIAAVCRPHCCCCRACRLIMQTTKWASHSLGSGCAASSAHAHRRLLVAAEAHRRPGPALLDDALNIQEVRPQLRTADTTARTRKPTQDVRCGHCCQLDDGTHLILQFLLS
jgi:hypothetical protein